MQLFAQYTSVIIQHLILTIKFNCGVYKRDTVCEHLQQRRIKIEFIHDLLSYTCYIAFNSPFDVIDLWF